MRRPSGQTSQNHTQSSSPWLKPGICHSTMLLSPPARCRTAKTTTAVGSTSAHTRPSYRTKRCGCCSGSTAKTCTASATKEATNQPSPSTQGKLYTLLSHSACLCGDMLRDGSTRAAVQKHAPPQLTSFKTHANKICSCRSTLSTAHSLYKTNTPVHINNAHQLHS